MIPPAQVAEIRRLFFAEHWRFNTIAAQLGVHHDAVGDDETSRTHRLLG